MFLYVGLPDAISTQQSMLVTSALLGNARIPGAPFVDAEGSPYIVDTDYFGKKRSLENPTAGPFEHIGQGRRKLKVW